jgi:hypothetical protein
MNLAATTALIALSVILPAASGFAIHHPSRASVRSLSRRLHSHEFSSLNDEDVENPSFSSYRSRRGAIKHACQTTVALAAYALLLSKPTASYADIEGVVQIPQSTTPPTSTNVATEGQSVTVYKTKSGLQYIDITEGSGSSPKYGNFVSIAYTAYIKLPDAKGQSFQLDEFDSDKGYLIKHGNGRTVPGLDEALHTMRVGGKRRVIIPPKLGYTTSGLGPIPVGPYGRWKLNRLIDRMVELRGGNVIFDVEMKSIMEDEADQGYYTDESLSPDDFSTLRFNLETSQQAARGTLENKGLQIEEDS